jgi:outer membrane protein TolC
MKKIFLMSLKFSLSLFFATNSFALTVKESAEAALKNNRQILEGKEESITASEKVNESLGAFLPDISYQYQRQFVAPYVGTKQNILGFSSQYTLPNNASRSDSLVLNQNLFSGGASAAAYKKASKAEKASEKNLENTIQSQIFSAIATHLQIIAAKEKIAAFEEDIRYLEDMLKAEKEKFDAGITARTNLAQTERSLLNGRSRLNQAKSQLFTLEKNYETSIGFKPNDLKESTLAPEKLLNLKIKIDKGQLLAQTNNPAIEASKFAYDASAYDTMSGVSAFSPRVDLQLKANRSFDNPGVSNSNDSRSALLNITVPIFSGGQTLSRYKQLRSQESSARIRYLNTKVSVQASANDSFFSFLNQQEAYQASRESVDAGKVVLDGTLQEYEEGVNSLVEVLRARNGLTSEKINYADQKSSLILAYYQMLLATGKISIDNIESDKVENEFITKSN